MLKYTRIKTSKGTIKKLFSSNAQGSIHIFLFALVVVLIGIAGTFKVITAHANTASAVIPSTTKTFYYSAEQDPEHEVIVTSHTGRSNQPWVITIHGGSWMNSDPSSVASAAKVFADKGYVTFNLGYPLFKPGIVSWQMQRDAINSEFAWIKAHHVGLGIDPNRGAVYGFSAGGHLALMLGLEGDGNTGIKAIVTASGVVQPRRVADDALGHRPTTEPSTPGFVALYGVEQNIVGCADTYTDPTCNAAWDDFSPQSEISPHDPAVMMFAGTIDTAVPHQSDEALAYWLKRQGVEASYTYSDGLGHTPLTAFDNGPHETQMLNFLAAKTK